MINNEENIKIDSSEILNYKWFNIATLKKESKYSRMINKIQIFIKNQAD